MDQNIKVKKLNNSSQWLKYLVSSENVLTKEFIMSIWTDLENNSKFRELTTSIQKLSSFLVTNSQLGKSSCYDNLRQTNDEIAEKMLMVENLLTEQILVEISSTYKSEMHTHAGFINYLFYAWANEMGICLRPDMLYYTIISETITHVLINNNVYSDFSKTYSKLLSDVKFDSQPDNFETALKMCFSQKALENIKRIDPMCGITSVKIIGENHEWVKLIEMITILSNYVPDLKDYYNQCIDTINKILTLDPKFVSENIFIIDGNKCESNHSYLVKGLFSEFFIVKHDYLELYPTHAHFLPYSVQTDKFDQTNLIKVCGMNYSIFDSDNNVLYPQYGESVYEVKHNQIFELLKGNNDNSSSSSVVVDEMKVKSMIKSTMTDFSGYTPSDDQIKNMYDSILQQNIVSTTSDTTGDTTTLSDTTGDTTTTNTTDKIKSNKFMFVDKISDIMMFIKKNTPSTIKKNWKTTIFVSTLAIAASATYITVNLFK